MSSVQMQGDHKTIRVNCNCKETGHELIDKCCVFENEQNTSYNFLFLPLPLIVEQYGSICSPPPLSLIISPAHAARRDIETQEERLMPSGRYFPN